MKLELLKMFDQLETILSGTQAVAFSVMGGRDICYRWIQGELIKFRYVTFPTRGAVIRTRCFYLGKSCSEPGNPQADASSGDRFAKCDVEWRRGECVP